VLINQANPYRSQLPPALRLEWDDFDFNISPANDLALGRMAEWTVVAYMAADCNLAELMFDDLMEMKAVGSSPALHLCVVFDGPLLTDSFFARLNAGTQLGEDIVLRFNELKSSDPGTLSMALRVAAAYPARRRVVFLSGHGAGWRGALLDENIGMRYTKSPGALILPGPGNECDARLLGCQRRAQELINSKLDSSASAVQRKFDLLAFDACYMGNLESVAYFADQADVLVVSEDQMPGEGYPYQRILTQLRDNPAQSAADFASLLVNETKRLYQGPGVPRRRITQVALSSDRLAPFANDFVRLVQTLGAVTGTAFPAARYALESAWAFADTGNIDLMGFVQKLLERQLPAEVREAATAMLDRSSNLVLASAVAGTSDLANGLSIYAPPPDKFDLDYIRMSNQLPLNLGIWSWFLGSYYLQLLGSEAPAHPLIKALQGTMEDLIRRGIYKADKPIRA
jgi:hypothetical protein